jgi:hypothetical protein
MEWGSRRLADEVRPFRPRRGGMPGAGWLEVTVYGLALLGLANVLVIALR